MRPAGDIPARLYFNPHNIVFAFYDELHFGAALGTVGGKGPPFAQGAIQINALQHEPLLEDRAHLILGDRSAVNSHRLFPHAQPWV
jgi:hypothetical protein